MATRCDHSSVCWHSLHQALHDKGLAVRVASSVVRGAGACFEWECSISKNADCAGMAEVIQIQTCNPRALLQRAHNTQHRFGQSPSSNAGHVSHPAACEHLPISDDPFLLSPLCRSCIPPRRLQGVTMRRSRISDINTGRTATVLRSHQHSSRTILFSGVSAALAGGVYIRGLPA